MRIWTVIYSYLAVLLLMFMVVVMYKDIAKNDNQYQTLRLKDVVENAAQAGFEASVNSNDLSLSYTNLNSVTLTPQGSLNVLKTVVLMSYNMSLSAKNYSDLDHYISSAVMATENGYYIATQKNFYSTKLTWGLKRPYVISYNNNKDAVSYNLNNEKWVLADESGPSVSVSRGLNWSELPPTIPIPTSHEIISNANTLIMHDINANIRNRDKVGEQTVNGVKTGIYTQDPANQFIYLPTLQTASGDNPITEPSLFVTLTGVNFGGTQKVSAQSVAGYQVVQPRRVLGFVQNGKKYYCYQGQLPQADLSEVSTYFNTVEQAADAGYYPDFSYLSQ